MAGEDGQLHLRFEGKDLVREFTAGHAGHRVVDQHEIEIAAFPQRLEGGFRPDNRRHEMTDFLEFVGDHVADQRVVIDQQDLKMRHVPPFRRRPVRRPPGTIRRSNARNELQ